LPKAGSLDKKPEEIHRIGNTHTSNIGKIRGNTNFFELKNYKNGFVCNQPSQRIYTGVNCANSKGFPGQVEIQTFYSKL